MDLTAMLEVEATLTDSTQKNTEGYRPIERMFLDNVSITPAFQPIVDLYHGHILGYEVLSRPAAPFTSPVDLFEQAAILGVLWDVECRCRHAALTRIATLPEEIRNRFFFLNISPAVLQDPRFRSGYTRTDVTEQGLPQGNIVIEITEIESIFNYPNFETSLNHYKQQGFKLAIDDFGAGHASLATMVACGPNFIKLDKRLTHNIHNTSYKQQLIRSMISFAENTKSQLIAEGIETREDLETLIRLGVRLGQGYYLARPDAEIRDLAPAVLTEMHAYVQRVICPKTTPDTPPGEVIDTMVVLPPLIESGSMDCEGLDRFFRDHPHHDHVIITEKQKPIGLITRDHFSHITSGAFGYSLVQKKPVEQIAKPNPLVIGNHSNIVLLARMAMQRDTSDMYDPVIVCDNEDRILGSITIRQLIIRASELEVVRAMDSNPLTGLPGNRSIQTWIKSMMNTPPYCVIYVDLDFFKCYNDAYGFSKGDEMILLCGQVLKDHLTEIHADAQLGHIGGDDFVIVFPGDPDEDALHAVCADFDTRKRALFSPEHIRTGHYTSIDRQGHEMSCGLVTASISIIQSVSFEDTPHPAMLAKAAADLKKKTKEETAVLGRSCFRFDTRSYRSQRARADKDSAPHGSHGWSG